MKVYYLTFASFAVLTIASQSVQADTVSSVGDLPGGLVYTLGEAISRDGTVVVGVSTSAGISFEPYRWTQAGGMVGLGQLAGGFGINNVFATSADGSVIVGSSLTGSGLLSTRWTQAGGTVSIGDLPGGGDNGSAISVSGDGNIIVGFSVSTNGTEAYRWTQAGGMVGLGDLAGGGFESYAWGISNDGSVIVGFGTSANGKEAYRWTQAGGMVGLGDLAGGTFESVSKATNDDGSVIVGYATSANGIEAFRWTQAGGMVGLGDLAGGAHTSSALSVNATGSVVVGEATTASGTRAFIWNQTDGMRELSSVLQANGANLTGWTLTHAKDVDATGDIVVGWGLLSGSSVGFIANVTSGGLTTPADMSEGVTSGVVPAQQSQSVSVTALGQALFAATRSISAAASESISSSPSGFGIAPAGGDEDYVAPVLTGTRYSTYLVGSVGVGHDNNFNNYDLNGTLGMTVQFDRELAVGFGVLESQLASETNHGGEARLDAQGGTVIAAYKGDNGLRLYGSSFIAHLSSETERAYLNGGGTSESRGKTTGLGYGAALRAGYEFQIDEQNSVMPYVEVQGSKSSLGAYTETGGAFPASFGKSKGTQVTSRVGASVEHKFSNDVTIGTSVAWAHRVKDDSDPLSVSLTGFSGNLNSGGAGDKDWAEASASATWNVSADTMISAELSGRSGRTQESAVSMSVGVKYSF